MVKGLFIWCLLATTALASDGTDLRGLLKGSDRESVKTTGTVWSTDVVWRPEERERGRKHLPLSEPLVLKSLKGEASVLRPLEEERALVEDDHLLVWDRITLKEKSSLVIEWRGKTLCEVGSGSQLQISEKVGGQPILRLFKGRLRVINESDDDMLIETLNAMVSVPTGKTDVIISAMNTLVAPREGKKVKIKTKKVDKTVATGRYGLVMPDGALLYTGGKGK